MPDLMLKPSRSLLPALMFCALIAGCGSTPIDTNPPAFWVPAARASLVTIDSSTSYALVHSEMEDLLVYEEDTEDGGRVTWLISLPAYPVFNMPVEVSADSGKAWVIEQPKGMLGHAAPAEGVIIVHHKNADEISAAIRLDAHGSPPTAGYTRGPELSITRRLEWQRRTPTTLETPDLVTHIVPEPVSDIPD